MTHPGELLSAYLDGELTREEHRRVLDHLDGCEPCRAELADLDSARTAVRALPMLEPPSLAAPEPVADVIPLRRRWPVRVAAAAAASIIAVAGVGAVRGGSTSPALDIDSAVDQHIMREVVDPGLTNVRAVPVVLE